MICRPRMGSQEDERRSGLVRLSAEEVAARTGRHCADPAVVRCGSSTERSGFAGCRKGEWLREGRRRAESDRRLRRPGEGERRYGRERRGGLLRESLPLR